jgi:hypothetical protein
VPRPDAKKNSRRKRYLRAARCVLASTELTQRAIESLGLDIGRVVDGELPLDFAHRMPREPVWALRWVKAGFDDRLGIEPAQLSGERLCDQVISRARRSVHGRSFVSSQSFGARSRAPAFRAQPNVAARGSHIQARTHASRPEAKTV